ncbi:hypothetical protein CLV51_104451 [Chitinophaga niastensis]|uniref:DUF5977 domain-containing protein n=1 Tax=Chitinophaga niastensis TaxID=536980 RepID=A0A2P8HHN9_CHINA|nr:DUF5977 domain-containing protein [Chitinophaga niastensis]PSL45744.1 hypothetical protein CLV51_104451 [Chitinophaga niastensis]
MTLRLTLYLLLTGLATVSLAQTEKKYSNYIPPSPNVASIQQYGNYPVSGATGLPTIGFPLFSVDLNKYSLPVNINYHASGRKTSLNYSSLGLGWNLNATAVISRTVKGRADLLPFQKAPYPIAEIANLPANYDKVWQMTSGYAFASAQTPDSQHDLYTYTLNGKSGKFILQEGQPVILSGEPIGIRPISENYFELTDDDGVTYLFGSQPGDAYGGVEFFDSEGARANDSWFVNSITTPYGEQIKFKYGSVYSNSVSGSHIWGNMSLFDQYEARDAIYNLNDVPFTGAIRSFQEYFMNYVTAIEFPTGKISFGYDTDYKLTNATLTDYNGNTAQKYTFIYKQIPGENLPNNNSMLLSELNLVNAQGAVKQKYAFDYNLSDGFQVTWDFPKQHDWWGYYNGNSGENGSNIPEFLVKMVFGGGSFSQTIGSPGGLAPSFAHKSYGMLRKITFPTGGNTQFVYEPNRYLDRAGALQQGPGIRVQQVVSTDGNGNVMLKLYKYGENENGAGALLYQPRKYDFASEQTNITVPPAGEVISVGNGGILGAARVRRYQSSPNPEVAEAYGYPVYYSKVTEYATDKNLNAINGKIEYTYSIPGLELYQRTIPNWGEYETGFWYQPVYMPPYGESKLTSKKIYKSQGADLVLQSSNEFTYATFKEVSIPEIFLAQFIFVLLDDGKVMERKFAEAPSNLPIYVYREVPVKGGASLKTAESHTVYENGQSLTTTTQYTYNNLAHLYPSIVGTTHSDGRIEEKQSKYPLDYSGISATDPISAGVKNLLQQHIYTPVLESSTFKSNSDGSNKQLIKTTFASYKSDIGLQDKLYVVENNQPLSGFAASYVANGAVKTDPGYKVMMQFNKYNGQGRLLEQEAPGNVKESYIWGYKSSFPVAKITGADYQSASQLITQSVLDNPSTDNAVSTETTKLRNGLPSALVNSYTFAPLIGMTSQTNERGLTTYYNYDDIGRLSVIKDHNKQVLKQYDYQFTSTIPAATDITVYRSASSSLVYTKSDCPAGMEGTEVRYGLPAGMFVSTLSIADAEQQSAAASALYGPLYANLLGECKTPVVKAKVQLNFNVTGVTPTSSISIKFMQGSNTVATASFPRSPSGPFTVDVPVGTYYLAVTIPSIYQNMNLMLSVTETGQSWFSNGGLGINSDAVSLSTAGTYNITISN